MGTCDGLLAWLSLCMCHDNARWVICGYHIVLWCFDWLTHPCFCLLFVFVQWSYNVCVVRDQMWMQMIVEKHSCEEFVGRLYRSFYEKHLEVFIEVFMKNIWLIFELKMSCNEFWFWWLKPIWFILLILYFEE